MTGILKDIYGNIERFSPISLEKDVKTQGNLNLLQKIAAYINKQNTHPPGILSLTKSSPPFNKEPNLMTLPPEPKPFVSPKGEHKKIST